MKGPDNKLSASAPRMDQRIFSGIPEIEKLLTYDNPRRAEYDELIAAARADMIGALEGGTHSFDTTPNPWGNREQDIIKAHLMDKPLFDLGGGSFSTMQYWAEICGASAYYNVEKYYVDPSTLSRPERIPQPPSSRKPNVIKMDMLDFVSRLQPNDCNFVINAIDTDLIKVLPYHLALAHELGRVVQADNIVCGKQSAVFARLDRYGFERVQFPGQIDPHNDTCVFVKK